MRNNTVGQRRNSRGGHRCYSICCWIWNANHSNLTGVRGQGRADAKTWFVERLWEEKRTKRWGWTTQRDYQVKLEGWEVTRGAVYAENRSGLSRRAMLGEARHSPGMEWKGMVSVHKRHTKTLKPGLRSHEEVVQPKPTGWPAKTTCLLLASNAILWRVNESLHEMSKTGQCFGSIPMLYLSLLCLALVQCFFPHYVWTVVTKNQKATHVRPLKKHSCVKTSVSGQNLLTVEKEAVSFSLVASKKKKKKI